MHLNITSITYGLYDYNHNLSSGGETDTGISYYIPPKYKYIKFDLYKSVSEIIDNEYFMKVNNTVPKNV